MRRWVTRNVLLLVAAAGAPVLLRAQAPQASDDKAPAFEVVSVKVNASGDQDGGDVFQGGRWRATNYTLRQLVRVAYQIREQRILGGPAWVGVDRFDVAAKTEGNPLPERGGPPLQMQLMIRRLLADRFHLLVHNETRELPIYALVLDRRDGRLGPHLQKSSVDCAAIAAAAIQSNTRDERLTRCGTRGGLGMMTSGDVTMVQLANLLTVRVDRIVVDKTGVTGKFDLDLKWTPDQGASSAPSADPNAVSIFTAVQEQLGLKLESTKGPVDVLVIDHVEKPTPD